MMNPAQRFHLLAKLLDDVFVLGCFFEQQLHHHGPRVELQILREINLAHTALAETPLDKVTAIESSANQRLHLARHGWF